MNKYQQKTFPTNTYQGRELLKAIYTKDKHEALKILQNAEIEYASETKTIDGATICGFEKTKEEKVEILQSKYDEKSEFKKLQEDGFRYFGSAFDSYKIQLTIDVYILDLIESAYNENITQYIYNLLDEMVKIHRKVLNDPFLDELFEAEYNAYIVDNIQDKITEISKLEPKDVKEVLQRPISKPLKWNAKKQIIGTLFGELLNKGIIEGRSNDLIEFLNNMFPEINKNTLKKSVKHYYYEAENKTYYDKKTLQLIEDFVNYLIESSPN